MKVIATADAPQAPVETDGARDVQMRVLIGKGDGAPRFTLRQFEVAQGGHTPRHKHGHEHEVVVESGSGTLWTSEGEWYLGPGVVALVPPEVEHQFLGGPGGLKFYCIVPNEAHAAAAPPSGAPDNPLGRLY
jgi:quercetin dioxygenase-like cupin family protein